jgi:hypothetical protein
MNCYLHPEAPATAFCRTCGRSLCALCQRPAEGTIFCQDHVPVPAYSAPTADPANPYFQQGPIPNAPVRTSPTLALILGFIPGVGAIYNGQYLKGLVHALIFGLLITIIDNTHGSAQPMVAILLAAFVFYMPFEAFHTAKRREVGAPIDEWSSILPRSRHFGRAPVGPIVLIAIGVLYLLNSLDLLDFSQIGRFWPVILIIVGAYMLYSRVSSPNAVPPPNGQPYPPYSGPASGPAPGDAMSGRHE